MVDANNAPNWAVDDKGNTGSSQFGSKVIYVDDKSLLPGMPHSGWVRKTIGSGNRAGRVSYEVIDSVAGATIPGQTPYPNFPSSVISQFRQKTDFLNGGANARITNVAMADSPYGANAAVLDIGDSVVGNPQYFTAAVALSTGINVSNGSIRFRFKPLTNFSVNSTMRMDRFDIQLYSAGTPASPGANYHSLTMGVGNAPYAIALLSTAPDGVTAGRWQTAAFPINIFSATGAGADLTSIKYARVLFRSTSGNTFTFAMGDVEFVPNPRTKAACIFRFDDAHASAYTYVKDALAQYGWGAVIYPGDAQNQINAVGRLSAAQIIELCGKYGWQLGSQAWSTENATTVAAMTSPQRLAEFEAIRTQARGFGLYSDSYDGTYFSNFSASNMTIYPDYAATFRTIVRFDSGNPLNPPLVVGEQFPPADPKNMLCLDGASVGWAGGTYATRLQNHVDQAIASKGLAMIAYHNDLASPGERRTAFETTLAYLDANRDKIEVHTMKSLFG